MTFNKADAAAAYTLLGVRYRLDVRWVKALSRGWENLERRRWQWENNTLLIQSTTDPEKRYTVTQDGCQCHAARVLQVCDHVAAHWICFEASRIHARAKRRTKYLDIDAAVAELF